MAGVILSQVARVSGGSQDFEASSRTKASKASEVEQSAGSPVVKGEACPG